MPAEGLGGGGDGGGCVGDRWKRGGLGTGGGGGGADGFRPLVVAAKPPGKRYHSSATHAAEPSYQRTISGVVPLNRY